MVLALSQNALLSLAKCTGKGLAMAASPTASSALVLEPRRPARTPAVTVPFEMPEGRGGNLHELKLGRGERAGAAVGFPHAERGGREMPSVGPQLGAIAPHIGLTWWRSATGHNGRSGSGPSIVKIGAGKLNVVQLA